MVISPYAKANFVDHTLTDQASVVNFIEYNWQLGTIPGSAAQLLTNPANTFDMANMFDFSTGATDIAGQTPYVLKTTTFQPLVTWSTPSAITYGTPLSGTQLNAATSDPSVTGAFSYSPSSGTVLSAGTHTLQVTFTPTSPAYATATASVTITVNKAPLTITPAAVSFPSGGVVPAITPVYTGLTGGDTATALTTAPSCTTSVTSSAPVGSYTSSCSGAVGANYTITYGSGSVTVTAPITPKLAFFSVTAKIVKGGRVSVAIACPAIATKTCSGPVTISVARKTKKKGVYSHVVLASGTLSIAIGHSSAVVLHDTNTGRQVLGKLTSKSRFHVTLLAAADNRTVETLVIR